MSLWKRGNVWWAYFCVDGIRHQSSTGTSNRRHAESILQKLKEDANGRRHEVVVTDPKVSLATIAAQFVVDASPCRYHLERLKFLLPFFGTLPVRHINKALALEYRRHRQAQNHVSDATVNRDLSVLRHVLYWALDAGLITSNPLARLRMVRERRVPRLVVNVGEELRLLEAAPGHLQRMIIAALDTGMRRGEITHQRWEHVDFDRRILLVTKSKTPEGEAREIPLTARLCRLLEGSRQEQGLIFCYEGRALRNIKTSWRATLRRAKLRHIRFHDLRHSFNCRLMEAGVIQEVRMALMGHSTAGRVHAAYTHVELPAKRRAIAQLEQWFQTQLETKGGTPNGNNTQNG